MASIFAKRILKIFLIQMQNKHSRVFYTLAMGFAIITSWYRNPAREEDVLLQVQELFEEFDLGKDELFTEENEKSIITLLDGGILADDMGLGKTLQAISVSLDDKEQGKNGTSLIVCKASLVFNWKEEFTKYASTMQVNLVVGTQQERSGIIKEYCNCDVLITSYDLLKRDIMEYEEAHFMYQILDEAQYIKNHGTAAAKSVKIIQSRHRLALTGTPIENRLSELWSIFDYKKRIANL